MVRLLSTTEPDKCWTWQGEVDKDGHCIYPGGHQKFPAQRSAMIVFGPEPVYKYEDVIETCGNKLCCNPRHLRKVKTSKCLI
jgi:hypothetical protein